MVFVTHVRQTDFLSFSLCVSPAMQVVKNVRTLQLLDAQNAIAESIC